MELSKRQTEIAFLVFLICVTIFALALQKFDIQGILTTLIGDGIMAGIVYLLFTRSQAIKDVIEALTTINKREKQRKRILWNIKQWSIEKKAYLLYNHGHLTSDDIYDPNLPNYQEAKQILEEKNIYELWLKGVEESNKLVDEGKKEIYEFEFIIHNALKNTVFQTSYPAYKSSKPYYNIFILQELIYDCIINEQDMNLKIEGRLLKDGGKAIAEGEPKKLKELKICIDTLFKDIKLRKTIQNFNKIQKTLENLTSLKQFYIRLNELIREYEEETESFHVNS